MPKRKTQSEFIEELEKLYGIDYYDFSKVQYINAESKIIIICPKHGEIIKNANTLVRKKGSICSKCTYDKIRLTDADLIKRANKVHEYKYSYPNLNYTQWHNKINIECPEHGEFKQLPYNHISKKAGCPNCHEEQAFVSFDLFIKRANSIHRNRYTYENAESDYRNVREKVTITCKKHGDFLQTPKNHMSGQNCPVCMANKTTSTQEKEIVTYIKSLKKDIEIKQNSRSIIAPNELDIFLPEYKLAIEYNGIYWHTEKNGKKGRNYHLTKTKQCVEKNITLLHIFGNEWKEKKNIWKSIIANKINKIESIYARKCEIKKVGNEQSKNFLNDNHLQGSVGASYKIGLFYEKKLVSLMTFSKPRFNKTVDWELARFATKLNIRVIGGASKLFKYFLKENKNSSIISYADKRFSEGNLYKVLGFKEEKDSPPNYFYTKDNGKLWSRVKFQKHKLKNLLEDFNFELTEWENMQKNKWDRIWDCGNKVFICNKN